MNYNQKNDPEARRQNKWPPHLGMVESITPEAVEGVGKYYTKVDNEAYFQSGAGVESMLAKQSQSAGTVGAATVTAKNYGDGKDITTVLTLTDFVVGALAGAGAALGVGNIVFAFPAGQHFELTSSFSALVLTCLGTAVATETGLGSVIASGAVASLTTATFQDRLAEQTISTAVGGGAAVSNILVTTAGIGTGIGLNTSTKIKNVFLNSAGTWNADNTANLTATGTIVLKWTIMS